LLLSLFGKLIVSVFWMYVLQNPTGQFYVGSTDNLERSLGEHLAGNGGRTTALLGPPEILCSEPQPDYSSALKRELPLEDWSHAKKPALMRGDGERLSKASKSTQELLRPSRA